MMRATHHGVGLEKSTRASIKCSLRPLQRKETSLWIGKRVQVILAFLLLQFKVNSSILVSWLMLSCLIDSLILLLGATIHACRSSGHHIVALERDADIFKEVLMHIRDPEPLPACSTPRDRASILDEPLQKRQRMFATPL